MYIHTHTFTHTHTRVHTHTHACTHAHIHTHIHSQVQQVVATTNDGEQKLDAALVVIGVGARPNVELLDSQVEMVPKPVGGIKVWVVV